jgi:flagellum-specific peptidoglycan hydrolase FlgJ
MTTPEQRTWVFLEASQAYSAGHIFPRMAACEAALESAYGTSQLSRLAFNLFGLKQSQHPIFATLSLPTKEYLDDQWVHVKADWVEYPSFLACFKDRMATLLRLRTAYQHYNDALQASTPEVYVTEVSKSWSTDPIRAEKCIAIFNEVWPVQNNSTNVQQAATGEQ